MAPKDSFSITNTTKGRIPTLPFQKIKTAILGKNYLLSLVFVSNARSRALNRRYRGKNKPANVLSFPYGKKEGEIFLDLKEIEREEKKFGVAGPKLVARMFIHGLFHLKGLAHGSKMERQEKKAFARFRV